MADNQQSGTSDLNIKDIIRRKRNGGKLKDAEIKFFVENLANETLDRAQIGEYTSRSIDLEWMIN